MRKGLTFLIILGLTSSFALVSFSADLKIGYVDIFKVFNDYEKTKQYDQTLETKKNEAEKQLEGKKETLEKMQKRLAVLKDDEKTKEQENIEKTAQEYRELERKSFIDIKKARDDKMKEIIEDINKIIADYAEKNGFNLIVNENAILYGDRVMDISSEILKIANKNYKDKEKKK